MSKNDGGPAYPRTYETASDEGYKQYLEGEGGMTLRDWFAGQATEDDIDCHLPIMAYHDGALAPHATGETRSREGAKYHYADMMLKVRG